MAKPMKIEFKAMCNGMEFVLIVPEADLLNTEKYFPLIRRGCHELVELYNPELIK